MSGDVTLIAKIAPKNDAFVGMVDAKQVLGDGATNTLPDAAVARTNVVQHATATPGPGELPLADGAGKLDAWVTAGGQGTQGAQGIQGSQGFQGFQGDGVQGTQGVQGNQGYYNPSTQGPQGVQGVQGPGLDVDGGFYNSVYGGVATIDGGTP